MSLLSVLLTLSLAAPAQATTGFVVLKDVDPTILHDIRYYTAHNFVGTRIDGYRQPLCILTKPGRPSPCARCRARCSSRGSTLKVYDCCRPQRAVDHFVRWAKDLADQRMKAEFYPRVDKTRLFEDGYIAEKSWHSRGSTLDLTIVKLPALPAAVRAGRAARRLRRAPAVPGHLLRLPRFAPNAPHRRGRLSKRDNTIALSVRSTGAVARTRWIACSRCGMSRASM